MNPYLKAISNAIKKLHEKGNYKPGDLANTKEYKNLIKATFDVLEKSVSDGTFSNATLQRLRKDIFLFSGLKTHNHLLEAGKLLVDKQGNLKPFEKWKKEVSKNVDAKHLRYLRAEYDFAVGSVQMAERWANHQKDTSRYYLQFRTAADERVRKSHAVLHNITLPKNDKFWDKYYPPNGWGCRCTAVDVLASNNEKSDSDKAVSLGEKATTYINKNGTNKLKIFRFNPGKDKIIFPPHHPYSKVIGAKQVKPIVLSIFSEQGFKLIASYKQGGKVFLHDMVDKKSNDYKRLIEIAKIHAKQYNSVVEIMPKIHFKDPLYNILYKDLIGTKYYKKCPDLRINGVFFEHEGFTTSNPKKALKNMLNRGLKQYYNVIIENVALSDRYIKKNIRERIKSGISINEISVIKKDKIYILYKNTEAR